MRNTILSLFTALLLCSCHNDTPADKICGFFDNAIEKVETATTVKELEDINEKLMQDIAVYSLSWSTEEYNKWNEEIQNDRHIEDIKAKYAAARQEKEKELTGK